MSAATLQPPSSKPREESLADTLAQAVRGIEAGRRVGWAKAFEAIARVDALEEQVRQQADELKVLRRAYSRLLGFIQYAPFPRSPIFDGELAAHFAAERTFRSDDAWSKGVALAREHAELLGGKTADEIAAGRLKRKSRARVSRALGVAARESGHTPEKCIDEAGKTRFLSCSCGHAFAAPDDEAAALLEHFAAALHGSTFAEMVDADLALQEDE